MWRGYTSWEFHFGVLKPGASSLAPPSASSSSWPWSLESSHHGSPVVVVIIIIIIIIITSSNHGFGSSPPTPWKNSQQRNSFLCHSVVPHSWQIQQLPFPHWNLRVAGKPWPNVKSRYISNATVVATNILGVKFPKWWTSKPEVSQVSLPVDINGHISSWTSIISWPWETPMLRDLFLNKLSTMHISNDIYDASPEPPRKIQTPRNLETDLRQRPKHQKGSMALPMPWTTSPTRSNHRLCD